MLRNSFFILICFSLFSCGQSSSENQLLNEATQPNGRDVYNQYCVVCHGDNGDAKVAGAKDLSITKLSEDEIKNIIKNGSENKLMRAFDEDLSSQELNALVEHLKSFKK